MVLSTCCSFKGPMFSSHHPHGIAQNLIVYPIPEDLMSSSDLRHQTCMCYIDIHASKTSIPILNI